MNYFFDESGKWSDEERFRLVLGGLVIPNNTALTRLSGEFSLLRATHDLDYLHAAEMTSQAKEDTYQIIVDCLEKGATAFLRIYPPEILRRSTRMSFEEVYMELAAELVSLLILGDDKPSVSYDMKFHYAYPLNIIEGIWNRKPYHYQNIMSSLMLRADRKTGQKQRILDKLAKIKKSSSAYLNQFKAELNLNDTQAITDYLWSELILQVQGKDQARELFRAQILNNLKSMNSQLKTGGSVPEFRISYLAKENKNAGIEVIDFLNNLVYIHGLKPDSKASSVVKKIYSLMTVQEIRA